MNDASLGAVSIAWCRDPAMAEAGARLFAANADAAYISHGELQGGRALAPGQWAPDLLDQIRRSLTHAASTVSDRDGVRLVSLTRDDALVGFALVRLVGDAPRPYAWLEDLVIAAGERRKGTGARALAWIAAECRAQGIERLFLESGLANAQAHDFFERHGFEQVSVVMMRDL